MGKRVAVLTDAISSRFYFPAWYKYYAKLFGGENLFVLTYEGFSREFGGFDLGWIEELPSLYNDTLRADQISNRVGRLLKRYDYVIHVDSDEFLVADPRAYADLRDYIERSNAPYVTAMGFDVLQDPDREHPLQLTGPLLAQRQFCFALTALNKTCLTAVPLTWNRGFHYCTNRPVLDSVYLMHMKRADLGLQEQWNEFMSTIIINDDFIRDYYKTPIENLQEFHRYRFRLSTLDADAFYDRHEFNEEFMNSITHNEETGMYEGPAVIQSHNVRIPEAIRTKF